MTSAELLVGLLGVVTILAGVSSRIGVPAPIPLIVAGVLVSLIPGLPSTHLEPNVVFFVFLPPLVYGAGFNSSPRDLRAQARRIAILAVGLVVATMAAVAVAVHAVVPGFGWPEAFVLGAILAPTDPVAAVAIMQRLRVAPQLSALVEGESLLNDGVGLVLYRVAVGVTVSGVFSFADALGEFAKAAAGGVAVGLAVGWVVGRLRRRISDVPTEIALSLFTPYAAYIAAEAATLSGILSAVTVGLYLGARSGGYFSAAARLEAQAFWRALTFLLESALFLLMGLQFADVANGIEDLAPERVALTVAVVIGVVTLLRLGWMFTGSPMLRVLIPGRWRGEPPAMGAGARLVAGWSGMRGAVSLAAALAVPAAVDGGDPFPQRNLIIFVVFCVIVVGIVVQGLSLPALIRRVGVGREHGDDVAEAAQARAAAAQAALSCLDEIGDGDAADQLRTLYESRLRHARAPLDEGGDADREGLERFMELRERLLRVEREAVIELRERGEISEAALRAVERDLDLQEARLA